MEMAKMHVVVVGGGYGGVRAVEHLAKHDGIAVTLIDQNSYHYMQAEVYDYIANKDDVSEIMVDLSSLCASFGKEKVRFVQDQVTGVDYDAKTLQTVSGTMAYDYLLLATGSRTYFPDFIKGLRENAHGVKTICSALDFKQRFEAAVFERIQSEGKTGDAEPFNIVIGGAGLSGVEIAAEMADYAKTFYAKGHFGSKPLNVYLIDAYETILYGMDPFLVDTAYKRLTSLGVKVWHNNRISEVEADTIILDNGKKLPYEFMIFTGGIIASTLTRRLKSECNPKGHLEVTDTLNVKDQPSVFAVGDIANICDASGKMLPPTAQLAEKSAEHAAKNIKRLVDGKTMRPYKPSISGVMIALGGEYGAGILPGGIKVKGYLAYWIKKVIFNLYKRPLRLRTHIGSQD
jgi:NADH dehydrogenase